MKTLELTVHPRVLPGEDGFWEYRRRIIEGRQKRLTDAELAATFYGHEYTRLIIERDGLHSPGDLRGQGKTLHRFATLPHYDDEEQS